MSSMNETWGEIGDQFAQSLAWLSLVAQQLVQCRAEAWAGCIVYWKNCYMGWDNIRHRSEETMSNIP